MSYYNNNNNNNNATTPSGFPVNGLPPALRRGSLDCFMVSAEPVREHGEDVAARPDTGDGGGDGGNPSERIASMLLEGARPSASVTATCYRLSKAAHQRSESPIDMRRLAENDSGTNEPRVAKGYGSKQLAKCV